MKWVADENVDSLILAELRSRGHEVWSVAEQISGVPDDEILERSTRQDALLLTADKDFGEMVFRQKQATAGVFLLRLAGLSSIDKARLVTETVEAQGEALKGAFSVLTRQNLRIRRSP